MDIPPELTEKAKNVELCIDTMFVNEIPFLATVSRRLQYRTITPLQNQSMAVYRSALDQVLRAYNARGFRITTIYCDNKYKALFEPIRDELDIEMNYASAHEHVPEAERNNRVIKERIRATFHRLPYKALPKVMMEVLAMESTKKLNYFPPKNGLSPYYSPHSIVNGTQIDYNKHCSIPFGTYCQAHDENNPKNSQLPRTIDTIYL